MDGYQHQQLSTFALTLYRYRTKVENADVLVGEMRTHSLVLSCVVLFYFPEPEVSYSPKNGILYCNRSWL